jgi:C-terminal processing protease CtpA/Prc
MCVWMQQTGIFVSRIDMGSLAEAVGIALGDEILAVNNVDVTDKDQNCLKVYLLAHLNPPMFCLQS